MSLVKSNYSLNSSTRRDIRNEIVNLFLAENSGTGVGDDCTRYEYVVESFSTYTIVIKRPGRLKGFDFAVAIPTKNFLFKKKNRFHTPRHEDIIAALKYSKINYPTQYQSVMNHLNDAFNCINVSFASGSSMGFFMDYNNSLHPIEVIVLATKWLFIEQDITYWNYSGRNMFWNELVKNNLV